MIGWLLRKVIGEISNPFAEHEIYTKGWWDGYEVARHAFVMVGAQEVDPQTGEAAA